MLYHWFWKNQICIFSNLWKINNQNLKKNSSDSEQNYFITNTKRIGYDNLFAMWDLLKFSSFLILYAKVMFLPYALIDKINT